MNAPACISQATQDMLLAAVQRDHPGLALRLADLHGFTLGRVEYQSGARWFFIGYIDDLLRRYGIPLREAA